MTKPEARPLSAEERDGMASHDYEQWTPVDYRLPPGVGSEARTSAPEGLLREAADALVKGGVFGYTHTPEEQALIDTFLETLYRPATTVAGALSPDVDRLAAILASHLEADGHIAPPLVQEERRFRQMTPAEFAADIAADLSTGSSYPRRLP